MVTWRGKPLPGRTVALALIASAALSLLAWVFIVPWRAPGNDTGFTPVQPIAFSHSLHVRELEVDCLYCHSTATTARLAGMPAANVCMNCHRFVAAPSQAVKDEHWQAARDGREVRRVVSEAMRQLYRSQGLDERLEPIPGVAPRAIAWARVTQFPDFAYFDHRYTNATTEALNGLIKAMNRNGRGYQFKTLRAKMLFSKGVRKKPVLMDVPRYGWRQDLMGMVITAPPSATDFGADISTLTAMFTKDDI